MLNNKINQKKQNQGFTLIEIMVTVTVFSLLFGIVSGLFVFALKSQKSYLASRELLDQIDYAAEHLTRQLRTAKRGEDPSGSCIPEGANYVKTSTGKGGIRFIHWDGACVEIWLGSDRILKAGGKNGAPPIFNLTPKALQVEASSLRLVSETSGDQGQPRVTLLFQAKSRVEGGEPISIQKTISMRNLNVR